MEPHNNSDSNFATQGQVDPSLTSYSRVSNQLLQSDCSKFGDSTGLDDFEPVICSNIVKTGKHEEYNRVAVHLMNEIPENTSSTSHLDTQAEELFSKQSFQHTREASERYHMDGWKEESEEDSITLRQNNILRSSEKIISSNWDERGKCGSESFGQSAGHVNNDKSYIMGKPMGGQQETDHDSPLCTKENYEKGAHTTNGMVKAEVSNVNLIQETNESDIKRNLLYPQLTENIECETQSSQNVDGSMCHENQEKYFCYDSPLFGETGSWIPVSVPPMSESEHDEWSRGFCSNGRYLPEGDTDWNQCMGEDKELTMWDVVLDMLLAARGKVHSLASGDLVGNMAWISSHLVEQAWKEMAQTLTEANFGNAQEILEADPPKWLPDSASSTCMLCNVRFHPIMCSRHHCRFCGGLFCNECTKGRSLLPEKFRTGEPQRVCDVCCVRLESVQPYLMDQVSRAAQLPTHDLTDLSTLRSWVNFPWGQSMEYEIYKAANTIRGSHYCRCSISSAMADPNRPVTGYPAAAAPPPPNHNGYPSAQPPPPATAYPYAAPPYYNNYPYPDPYAAQRNTFLRRVIAILVASTIITGTILFVIWIVILPRIPEFQVDSLSVSNLNLSNSLITANWDLRFTARNPNKKLTLYYDEIAAAIFYDSLSIADTTVPPFFMDRVNETSQEVRFVASGAYVEKWAFEGMGKERAEKASIRFNVRMVARVSFKAGAWRARRRYLRVYCGDLSVGVALNKSSGNLLGGQRQCRVGL